MTVRSSVYTLIFLSCCIDRVTFNHTNSSHEPIFPLHQETIQQLYLPWIDTNALTSAYVYPPLHPGHENDHKRTCVVMLHGFPDNAATFDSLLPHLPLTFFNGHTNETMSYVSLVLPGYQDETRILPHTLVAVFGAQLRQAIAPLQCAKVHLIGHDWGASIVGAAASFHPQNYASVTMLAVPPYILGGIAGNPIQIIYSWYMLFFQLPLIPKIWLSKFHGLEFLWKSWSPNFTPNKEYFDQLKLQFRSLPHISSSMSYYRYNVGGLLLLLAVILIFLLGFYNGRFLILSSLLVLAMLYAMSGNLFPNGSHTGISLLDSFTIGVIDKGAYVNRKYFAGDFDMNVTSLVLAGLNDGCISVNTVKLALGVSENTNQIEAHPRFSQGLRVHYVPSSGHFLHQEQPEVVASVIVDFWKSLPHTHTD